MFKFLHASNTISGIFQLTLPISIYFGIQSGVGISWWIAAFMFYSCFYILTGNNVGLHRYFSHGHFTVSKPVEYLFLWAGATIGVGSPFSYAMTHVVHHRYPDTELDPHGPIRGWKSVLMLFQQTVDPARTPIFSRRMLNLDRRYGFLHRYYLVFFLSYALLLFLIDFRIFLFLWAIPASMACWGIGWGVVRQHRPMGANNTKTHQIEPLFEGLHLNHHLFPMAPNSAVNKWEIDWTYQWSRLFFPKYNWKGQPNKHD